MCPPNTVGRTCGQCNYTYWGWNETVGCQVMDYFIFFQFDMLNGDAVVHAHCSTDKDRNLTSKNANWPDLPNVAKCNLIRRG